ncbi:alpha-keto acid decarboxylase family protein [Streptomyces adustus]|uniref:alpha-keto acid decarboxylase family protein n=1 Tax=Streptomyces adustus TaxID=1609272 RepID=UPI003716935D
MSATHDNASAPAYTVGDYLLTRLAEAGVRDLFGVPGDYNLAFLDHVLANDNIRWVGTANELDAAYAADGYGRVNGVGALLTTFGVGELSAINGVAGSYAEYVPVIHVVGAPSTSAEQAGALMHHTLGDGDFHRFARAHREVTAAQAYLRPGDAAEEIDRVIATALRERRPGYLVIPTDVAAGPAEPPAVPLTVLEPDASQNVRAAFAEHVRTLLEDAGSVTVLADFLADRFDALPELNDLVSHGMPYATLSLGKGILDETDPGFVGVYSGSSSDKPAREAVETADVVLSVGVRFTDTTTTGFSQQLPDDRTVDVQPFDARVGSLRFAPLPMRDAVRTLAEIVAEHGQRWERPELTAPTAMEALRNKPDREPVLHQDELWAAIEQYLRPADILVAEQGTAFFGAQGLRLPPGVTFIGQPLWGSIGYTVPATLGAQTAEPNRRTVLVVGDGSAQLTAQEIGTMIREGRNPLILLLNNSGYTVERAIHGSEQRYNDISPWNWSLLPAALGGGDKVITRRVTSPNELSDVLDEVADPTGVVLVEVMLPVHDVPPLLAVISQAIARANAAT